MNSGVYVSLGVLPLPGFFGELGGGGQYGVEKIQVFVEQYFVDEGTHSSFSNRLRVGPKCQICF